MQTAVIVYVDDIMKDISIGDIQIVIQNLLKEGVAVRDLKTILETISLLLWLHLKAVVRLIFQDYM